MMKVLNNNEKFYNHEKGLAERGKARDVMITIFNRKELILTYSMKTQADARMLLSQSKIPYKITTKSIGDTHSVRGHSGVPFGSGLSSDLLYEYRIFVHKNDYEKACAVLQGKIK